MTNPYSDNAYVLALGLVCPRCESTNLDAGSFQVDGGCAWSDVSCTACGATWRDEYNLVGYSRLEHDGQAIEHVEDHPPKPAAALGINSAHWHTHADHHDPALLLGALIQSGRTRHGVWPDANGRQWELSRADDEDGQHLVLSLLDAEACLVCQASTPWPRPNPTPQLPRSRVAHDDLLGAPVALFEDIDALHEVFERVVDAFLDGDDPQTPVRYQLHEHEFEAHVWVAHHSVWDTLVIEPNGTRGPGQFHIAVRFPGHSENPDAQTGGYAATGVGLEPCNIDH